VTHRNAHRSAIANAFSRASLSREITEISWDNVCREDRLLCGATNVSDSCSCAEKLCYKSCRETPVQASLSSLFSKMRYDRLLLKSCFCDRFYVPYASSCAFEDWYRFWRSGHIGHTCSSAYLYAQSHDCPTKIARQRRRRRVYSDMPKEDLPRHPHHSLPALWCLVQDSLKLLSRQSRPLVPGTSTETSQVRHSSSPDQV